MAATQVETSIGDKGFELFQQIGEGWIQAIIQGDWDRLENYCQPYVQSDVLLPHRYFAFEKALDLAAKVREWFGECSAFTIEHTRIEPVGERLGICYRLRFLKQGAWKVAEQQLYCTLQDERIARLHLLCSGFQPIEAGGLAGSGQEKAGSEQAALLVIQTGAEDQGSTCALLTPAIKARLREMESGQVLEVRVDDPSARQDIEAWCRLSGNSLLKISAAGETDLHFWVRKK
jgi:TusA-related sulfurtransferase